MYLDDVAQSIRERLPAESILDDAQELFRAYAVLMRAKGTDVSASDVHDAWAAWQASRDPNHEALVPFLDLGSDVAAEDSVFVDAIREEALNRGIHGRHDEVIRHLFPGGRPPPSRRQETVEHYQMMVQSSESLVARRQGVNTFFMTVNGALLTALALVVDSATDSRLGAWAVAGLAVTGGLLAAAWRSLIRSFGQLNTGKFRVINAFEQHLGVAVYDAEWEALARGKDPNTYRSFTDREVWVPNTLIGVFLVVVIASVLIASGVITLS